MRTIILTSILTVLFGNIVYAETKDLNDLGIKGVELIFNMQFDEANKVFDKMIWMEPENAIGYFLKSKNYFWTYFFCSNDKEHINRFKDLSFKTIDISKEMLDKNKDNVDALFYISYAYGYLGRWYGEEGSWIKAFWYGRKSTKYLKRVIEINPEYYDAYFGLGMYHYYLDVLPKLVKPLSFLMGKGDKEKGIHEVTLSSSKGNLTSGEAKYILADVIYFQIERNNEAALPLFEELTTKYPGNLLIKMRLASCYEALKEYDKAISVLKEVVKHNPDDISYRLNIGWVYVNSSQFDKAFKTFEKIIEDDPTFSNGYYQMGRTSIISGQRLNEADKYFIKYLGMKQFDRSPTEAWAHFRLGQVYEMTGRIEQAKKQFKTALKLDRKHTDAKEALKKLR